MKRYKTPLGNGEINQILHVSENLLSECFFIANMSRPNNAATIHGTMTREVNENKHILFVYTVRDYVYGFIKGHIVQNNVDIQPEARIDWLFVDPSHQRSGIGAKLIAAYENHCIGLGAGRILVQPAPTPQSKNFYAKFGYGPCGITFTHAKDLGR